jgi:heptosyltransferase I
VSVAAGGLLGTHRSRRVGIVLLTGIGDVVHGLPLACDLKRQDPTREIVWIAEPVPAQVLAHHPAVDRVVPFRKGAGVAGIVELFAALRATPCDVTVNLMRYLKGVFPAIASGAPVRLGLPPSKTRDGVRWFNTHHLSERPWCHTQDLFLGFRGPLGLPVTGPVEWDIGFSPDERAAQAAFFQPLAERGRPVTGLVLATANPAKDWPAERQVGLVERLESDLGLTVLLIGGPSAVERAAAWRVLAGGRTRAIDGLGDSVRRMMWMVDAVDVLVSPDTGPLHVAHALETPVVGLFGHTNPWRVGPWIRYHDLVIDRYTDPGEAPDPSRYQPRHGRMERITVDEIVEVVAHARDRYP